MPNEIPEMNEAGVAADAPQDPDARERAIADFAQLCIQKVTANQVFIPAPTPGETEGPATNH